MTKPDPTLILRDDRIVHTVEQLSRRITDRFPGSSLSSLCDQLLKVAQQSAERSRWIAKPIRWLRWTGYAIAAFLIIMLIGSIWFAIKNLDAEQVDVLELISAIEAGINEVILLAIAVFFLVNVEVRIKRRRALAAIHELRSIAHVIDMHQLTKDPERLLSDWADAAHSPKETLTPFQMNRYLDYCSEMLSLTGKIAALTVQHFDDAEAIRAVGEVEDLTTGLSRKIWQKIMMLEQSRVSGLVSSQ
ncbi:MAG: hypothetical protein AAF745_10350 [Planctomycetota bacterium]